MNNTDFARMIRVQALEMVHRANASHIGGVLSMADILAVLYLDILRVRPEEPKWPDRDRFILSKGHCCAGVYAALALRGFIPIEELQTYGENGSRLLAHVSHKVPGVEFSTGSLGHGLPFGVGKALAARRNGRAWRTFVLLSDGELDEGSNWEAFLMAPQHNLDNLCVIIDYNRIQSLGWTKEIIDLEPLADKLRAFQWSVVEVDGHDVNAVAENLKTLPWESGKPSCVIAHTTKGKGVSFMEDQLLYHYRPPDTEQLSQALKELETNTDNVIIQ